MLIEKMEEVRTIRNKLIFDLNRRKTIKIKDGKIKNFVV